MAIHQKELVFSAVLVLVCVYALVVKSFDGIYATVSDIMFLVTGGLGVTMATMEPNQNLRDGYKHAFFIAQTIGLDLFMVDICIKAGVDKSLALLNLVPPLVDILMRYFVDSTWKLVTPCTHVVSLIFMCYLGFRDEKFVLFVAAGGFGLALVHYMHDVVDTNITHPLNAIGVFFVGWCLAGKDLNDLGIPLSNRLK